MEMKKIQEYILDPYQIAGLIDSEGHFSFYIRNQSVNFLFKISQRDYSVTLFEAIKYYFNNKGQIQIENEKLGTLQYSIRDINTLSRTIIPFFEKYPLLTSKNLDYQDFKSAVHYYINCGLKINYTNKNYLIRLKNQMNLQRSWESRWNWSKNSNSINSITDGWIAGMIEGDGSLEYSLNYFRPTVQISQNAYDRPLLEKIQQYINAGYLKPHGLDLNMIDTKNLRLKKNDWKISGNKAMVNIIFPLLDRYNFYSRKGIRLQLLKQLVNIFYMHQDPNTRKQLMSPLINELQKKILPTGDLSQWRKR